MEPKRNKDNLTDLIDEISNIGDQDNDGKVETPSGQIVTLAMQEKRTKKKALAIIKKAIERIKADQEREGNSSNK